MGFRNTLSGSGFVVLNLIRGLNIIALLLVMAASMVMVVKTIMVSQFYIFDGVTHIVTTFIAISLVITEVNLFQGYIARNWPLFGLEHGFVTLALFMLTMAISVLGNLNKGATSTKTIGNGFYELVMAAGVLTFIMGWFNLIANFMFRKPKYGVTARMVRAHGKQAARMAADSAPVEPHPGMPMDAEKYPASSYYGASREGSVRSSRTGFTEQTVLPTRAQPYNYSMPMGSDGLSDHPPMPTRPDNSVHPALRGTPF